MGVRGRIRPGPALYDELDSEGKTRGTVPEGDRFPVSLDNDGAFELKLQDPPALLRDPLGPYREPEVSVM